MSEPERPRVTAGLRLQRLLAVVSWVAAADGPTLGEVCTRFEISEEQLVEDLQMAMMVGGDSADYSDMPIEVVFEDGRVWVHLMSFGRPLRLTPAEGLTLVAAGSALLDVPGTDAGGPLARALSKLADILGIDAREAMDVDLGHVAGEAFAVLRRAAAEHRQVEIESYTESRDVWSTRIIEPWRLLTEFGRWYVHGYCQQAAGERIFRIDHIRRATLLDTTFDPPAVEPSGTAVLSGSDLPEVSLELTPEARWVTEAYPVVRIEEHDDGRLTVTLAVSGLRWLERLLLRLGPEGRVVEIDPRLGGLDVGARAAERVAARYSATPAGRRTEAALE
jgi:proteasome accessory factor C